MQSAVARRLYRTVVPGYPVALVIVGFTTLIAALMYRVSGSPAQNDQSNVVMVFLLGVVAVAIWHGRGPAILASFISVGLFDFLFVPPFYTLAVRNPRYLVNFAVMLVIAVLISELTERLRTHAEVARLREQRTAALLTLSRKLAASVDAVGLIQIVLADVTHVFNARVNILQIDNPVENRSVPRFRELHNGQFVFDDNEKALAHRAYLEGHNVLFDRARSVYVPLIGPNGTLGLMGVKLSEGDFTDPEQLRLLEAFSLQATSALERARLSEQARTAWEQVEKEFLRNTLLSSVSHDIRTPLAAIIGTAETLLQADDRLDAVTRKVLIETLLDESRRMERTVANLLDVTRLESGGLSLKRDWHPLCELVGSALQRTHWRLGDRHIQVDVPHDLPMIYVDGISFEQVLVNLLDNAAEYTPLNSKLQLAGLLKNRRIIIKVADNGPGIPAGKEKQIFEKFFRSHPESGRRGIGLGLAICKGIVEAHGGSISAFNGPRGGATFQIELPQIDAPETMPRD